jgi:outer membrane protein OmpA-like peptidoglycan-associated protein
MSEQSPLDNGGRSASDFAALRRILVGPEQHRIEELASELEEKRLTAADVAEHLPEAILLRAKRDRQIGRALAPTVETALRESIRKNPREIAAAIFPVLGPAIRKAIAETMASLVRSINSAVEHSFSPRGIRWRIESWRTGVPYAQVVISHALIYRVEQAFLIHAETGLLLSHATAPDLKVPDADLISGMMTAIQDFVRDSFRPGEGATLRTFSVGEHTVQVEAGPLALLALVIRGQAPDAVLRKQQDVLETIHVQFASPLMEFNGDAAAFEPAHALLEECLETVVDTGPQRRGRFLWMNWAIPTAAVAIVLVALVARSQSRFDRAVAAIDNEPGLVVIDSRQSWGRWEISGLRDPGARDPAVVLAGAGLAPRVLQGRWESYLSLDSAVVVGRARQALRSPSTLMQLRGDTLTVSGDVSMETVRLATSGRSVAGVGQLNFDSVRIQLPPALDSIRQSIAQDRILFAAGSADVPADAAPRIREAARRFRVLDDSVSASGVDVILTLVGRTDPTGSDETNQALAQWRVDRVAAIFASAGVRTQRLRSEALATSRPLTSADRDEQARINRSVSFEVTVSPTSATARGQ